MDQSLRMITVTNLRGRNLSFAELENQVRQLETTLSAVKAQAEEERVKAQADKESSFTAIQDLKAQLAATPLPRDDSSFIALYVTQMAAEIGKHCLDQETSQPKPLHMPATGSGEQNILLAYNDKDWCNNYAPPQLVSLVQQTFLECENLRVPSSQITKIIFKGTRFDIIQ